MEDVDKTGTRQELFGWHADILPRKMNRFMAWQGGKIVRPGYRYSGFASLQDVQGLSAACRPPLGDGDAETSPQGVLGSTRHLFRNQAGAGSWFAWSKWRGQEHNPAHSGRHARQDIRLHRD